MLEIFESVLNTFVILDMNFMPLDSVLFYTFHFTLPKRMWWPCEFWTWTDKRKTKL